MSEKRNVEEFLATARKRFAAAEEAEAEIRREAKEDIRFVAGKQWDPKVIAAREQAGRPALTFNSLPTFVHQVSNEARQNKLQIKFTPAEDGDKDTAEIFEGLARQIQRASRADIAFETAVDYTTAGSFGHFRLLTDYCDTPGSPSFDQELKFAPIGDPFAVYGCLLPRLMGQKPKWAFVVEAMTHDDYKAEFGESELSTQGFEWGTGVAGDWIGRNYVRVAEYWYTETKKRTFQLLSDGSKVYSDEQKTLPPGVTVKDSRTVYENTVKFCKTNGVEILEETEWIGKGVPIYTVLGWQLIVDEKYEVYSLVRFLRDPSKLVNVYKSGIAEQIGLANRVPYIGYKGQFKDPRWQSANITNYAYLEVEPLTSNGTPAPLPQRQQFEAPIQALSLAAAQEIDDLKRIAGIHDASLGAEGNETSGIAIQRRQAQSGLINYHILDNLKRAQDEAGEELGYAIPRAYDGERIVRILGDDETDRVVKINAPYVDPETGKTLRYMLTAGKYDVVTSSGPSNTTKRQEAAESTGQVIQAAPEMMGVIGDIYFRNSDAAGADETADRVKKWITLTKPGLIEDEKSQPIPPQAQAQMAAMDQQNQQLTAALQQLTGELEAKKFELDSRERIAAMQEETKRTIALAQIDQRDGLALLQAEIAAVREQLAQSHQAQMADDDRAHQAQQAEQQQAVQQQQQQQPLAA